MCGIAGFILKDPNRSRNVNTERLLDALLAAIDHRGGDATGFVARNREGHTVWHKASCDARKFTYHRRPLPNQVDVCLAHTRLATNGLPAFPENNHPVKRGPFYVVHNGIVYNDHELFQLTERTPYGQVDSEALAAVLAHHETIGQEALDAFEQVDGTAAIAALDERDGTVLLARISGSPLYVLETRRAVIWASTYAACEKAHRAGIGSIGRAKPRAFEEGEAAVYVDGAKRRYTFEPPQWKFSYTSSLAATSGKQETTGSYNPGEATYGSGTTLARWNDREHCELCGTRTDDLYDLWDNDDLYESCEGCWNLYGRGAGVVG